MRRETGASCDSSNCLHCHSHVLQPAAPDASCRRSSLDSLNRAWASETNLTCMQRCSADFCGPSHAHSCDNAPLATDVWLPARRYAHAWQPSPSWDSQPHPSPASLISLASFKVPVHQGRRDLLGGIGFSDSGHLLATASVGKQVHAYHVRCSQATQDGDGGCQPFASHRMPSKLSCLTWVPDSEVCCCLVDLLFFTQQCHHNSRWSRSGTMTADCTN